MSKHKATELLNEKLTATAAKVAGGDNDTDLSRGMRVIARNLGVNVETLERQARRGYFPAWWFHPLEEMLGQPWDRSCFRWAPGSSRRARVATRKARRRAS